MSVLPEWLPFMDFKRTARRWREQYDAIATKAHEYVEEEIVSVFLEGPRRAHLTFGRRTGPHGHP